jgi:hypothetical protein
MKVIETLARTTNGNSGDFRTSGGEFVRAQLNIASVTGTSPTLSVVVEDSIDGVTFNPIGNFTQKTAAGREILNITTPFTENLRVSWTITGAAANFTFGVDWFVGTRRVS